MDLHLDPNCADGYKSGSQIARVVTENWVAQNSFCPSCGNARLTRFDNNRPVADFLCEKCEAEYELKSKKDVLALRVVDGAYRTMITRIQSRNNPHFLFLHYSSRDLVVVNLLVVPRHFFVTDIIERRKPLSPVARRAGWQGCNILLGNIPTWGRIFLVKDRTPQPIRSVREIWDRTSFLKDQKFQSRGWTIEILRIVDKLDGGGFNLSDVYSFEHALKKKFPKNRFIKDKIRQQLQILRDRGILEFTGRGTYRRRS